MARIFEEKFGSFTAAGFGPTPTAGQLDSDIWVVRGFGDNATPAYGFSGASGTDFGRGIIAPPTDPTTGGVYAGAITAADRALIVQPTGSEFDANGVIEARVKNTSGATATSFTVDFDWIARNNGDRADAMTFSYSTDGTNFTNVPAAAFTSPATLAAGAGFVSKDIAPITLSGLSVAANADLFLRWTHTTSTGSGSRDEVGIDNVTVDTGAAPSGPSFSIAPLSASKAEGNSGTTDFTFTVTRTDSTAAASIDWTLTGIGGAGQASATDFTGPAMGSVAFAIGQTSQTVTLKVVGDTTPESSESFTVTLANPPAGATIATGIANGTIVSDDIATTRIHDIQGVGSESPIPTGQAVTIEAIVVGDFQNGDGDQDRNLNGFYLQEQNANWDADAKTSEGVFVFLGQLSGAADVNVGDKVQVTGTVSEYFGQTQLTATQLSVVQANAVADVSSMAAIIDLPAATTTLSQSGVPQPDLEAYENMLVRFSDQLVITEQFNLDRFNEIKLVAGERPYQFTQTDAPSAAGYQAHLAELGARTITYDDGQNIQNAPIGGLDGFGGYNTANAPRMGDTITGLTGVLDYQWSGNSASQATWRVRSVEDGDNSFSDGANTRQAAPSDVGGSLKVASLNVLNYFKTLDTSSSARTAIGVEPRGANNAAEFQRQTDKLVNVILKMNVDVLGLVELENDFQPGSSGNAIEYLVNQLNAKVGAGTYDWVRPGTQFVGGDAIGVGAIYKTGSVEIAAGTSIETLNDQDAAAAALLGQSSKGHIFDGADTSRNALAVTFQDKASGEDFTIAVNHFKSKGGAGTGADADAGNGAGFWNNQRELAAKALDAWLDSKPTGTDSDRTLIMGDLNAYAKENPIAILEAGGYENFGLKLAANYSYTFDGQLGTLDYVLGSEGIADEVTGVTAWHINSDEADALDYNTDFSRDPAIFDATTAVRVSDHDPMIIGLNLQGGVTPPPAYTLQLLHLSDLEGGTLAAKTAPILGALVDRFDDQYANTLVLSGGDNYIPGPFLTAGADPSLNALVGTTALGRPDIAIMNALGIDASAIGNHEWDLGSAVYGDAIKAAGSGAAAWVGAQFPLLSANLDFSGDAALRSLVVAGGQEASAIKAKIAPSAIVTQGGEKIGIVAATTQVLERISSPTGTEVNGFPKAGEPGDNNVEVDNMALLASQLQPVIDALIAQGSNKIILTSHLQNLDNEKALAPLLKGVDIILSAGSHTALGDSTDTAFPGRTFAGGYPFVTADKDGNTTVIVSTDGEYSYLGRLVVDFDANGHVVVGSIDKTISGAYSSTDATLNQVYGADIGQAFADGSIGDKVKDISGAVQSVIAAKDGAVYGYSNVYLEGDRTFGRFQETNLGDFTADANTAAARIAVGEETFIVSLKNGGGIRASIGAVVPETGEKIANNANPDVGKPAGAISQLDVENALRFDNKLMVFDTTAQGLLNILNFGAGLAPGNGGFPQLGGVEFSYDPDLPVGSRVQDVALVREDGSKLALVDDGVILATAPAKISVVTLNFTANNGDGYPAKANGENFRYLLNDGTLSAAIDEAKDFTAPANVPAGVLGEQKAFIDYLKAHFATPATAFDIADTGAALDERIQNLNLRGDTVLDGTGTPGGEDPGTPPAEPNDPGIPAILATAVDGVLRGVAPDNIDKLVADYESGALKLDGFVSELVKQAGDSSVPALIFANFMEGVTPTSARLDSLSVFADQQVTAYAAKGAGLPVLGAYEALGLGFSETTGFRTKYEGDTENAFILEAYQDVFGRAATTAQVAHFQAQIDYFENLYVGSKQSEAAAELHAKGAVLGQMIGVAVLNENKFKAAAEAFLIDAADGEVAYGRPLGAQSAFMTDMFV